MPAHQAPNQQQQQPQVVTTVLVVATLLAAMVSLPLRVSAAAAISRAPLPTCPTALYEMDTWSGDAYMTAVGEGVVPIFTVTPHTGRLTISLWVRLAPRQTAANAMLFQIGSLVPIPGTNRTRPGDSLTVSWSSTTAVVSVVLVNNASMDGGMPVESILSDDGTVPLNTDQYRNVVVMLDAVMGVMVLGIDAVPSAMFLPTLVQHGFQLRGPETGLSIGADYMGNSNAMASFSDLTVIPDIISLVGATYLTQFRLPTKVSKVGNATPTCVVAPSAFDTEYPFAGVDVQTFYFTPTGNTFPNATVVSPYAQFGFYPLYVSPFSLAPQTIAAVNITRPSWTPAQFQTLTCGATQSGTIAFPTPDATYNVTMWLTSTATPPVGATLNVTTSTGVFLTNFTVTAATDAYIVQFLYQNYALDFNVSATIANFCIGAVVVAEVGSVVADPSVLFTGASSTLAIYAGVRPTDKVAISSTYNCYNMPASSLLTPVPVMVYDWLSYYTVSIPEITTPGMNVLCVYPNGVINGQAYVASRCPKMDNTNSFLCSLSVAPLPAGSIPLTRDWVSNFLHLGSGYYDAILHGLFEADYFIQAGGERKIYPQPGDVLDMTAAQLVWTPMNRPGGIWGSFEGNMALSITEPEWVQYFALGLYSSVDQVSTISVRAWSAAKVFVDGNNVFQLNPSYTNNSDAASTVYHSNTFTIRKGWHQVLVKLWRAPSVSTSLFSLRFDAGDGLSWNYNIPSNSSSNSTNPNTCLMSNKNVPCIPGDENVNVSHYECVAMGCCYDPGNVNLTCFAPNATLEPYRTDGHCGLGWPSAVTNLSICNAQSSTGSSCCSQHSWCGSSVAHCDCPTCTNSKYLGKPHCNYLPWGRNARCLGSRTVPLGVMSDNNCRVQCDFTTGCIGYQSTIVNFSPTCTLVFSGNCATTITDTTVTQLYLRSCNACNFLRNTTTGVTCGSPMAYRAYGISAPNPAGYVTYAQCTEQCTMAVACKGVLYNSTTGRCSFMQQACPSIVPAGNDSTLAMYNCSGDLQTPPTPLPAIPNNTVATAIGCFPDYSGTFLSAATYGAYDASNQYTANYNAGIANLTLDKCMQYCWAQGAPYYALSKRTICTCGVRLPENLPAKNELLCTSTCPGNASEVCGGTYAASVFRVNYQAGPCPAGFSYFNGNCYQYFGQSGSAMDTKSWHDARDACNALGASMASVHSPEENQYVLSFTYFFNESNTRIAWVGGYQYPGDNTYQWEDGSPWDFSDWRPNEPNEQSFLESCLTAFSNYPTPYKGSFNDDGCQKPYPYICKMPAAGSTIYPTVYATVVDGTINCAAKSALGSFDADLAAWYAFDTVSNYSNVVVRDQSANRRDITFNTTTGGPSGQGATATPVFVPGVVAMAAVLNGTSYFLPLDAAFSNKWDIPRNQLSISVWMQQTGGAANENQIIVSKSYAADASDTTVPQFEWALGYRNNALCFMIGPYRACAQAPMMGTWTHVVGTFDGALIELYLNGTLISSFDTVLSANVTFYFPKNPNTTVVIGYRSATPLDTTRMFVGLLDDLRIFHVQINLVQIAYLFYCTPNGAPANTINVYDNTPSMFLLGGEGFGDGQSFALSTMGCAPGTPVYMSTEELPYGDYDTLFAALAPPGIPALPPSANTTNTYDICHVNQLDRSVVYGDTSFRLAITAIHTVNGYMQQMTVNTTQFPLLLQLSGVNLMPGQVMATTMDADCTLLDAVYPLTSVSADGTSGYVQIQKPALITDVIHLCWGASPLALGETSAESPVGIATGDNLKDIGITILMLDPNGLQYKMIAAVDGTTSITSQTVLNGMSGSYSNYFLQCTDANYFGDNYFAVVQMGIYEDYLIPRKGVSVCDLLASNPWQATHYYTANNPLSGASYPADAIMVPPTQQWSFLGGSPYGFPTDGRQYLSAWGGSFGSATTVGGFGQATPQQVPEWFQSYSIVIWAVPNTTYYMRLSLAPTLFTPGGYLMIEAQLLDNHNELVMRPTNFLLTFPTDSFVIASTNGRMAWNRSLHLNDTMYTGQTFPVNVTALDVTVANGASQIYEATMGGLLPAGLTPVNPNQGVLSFLHFGNLSDAVPAPYFFSAMYDDWFAQYGGEANMRPVPNQTNTARADAFSFGDDANYTYKWQVVTDPTGYWRDSAPPYTVQFFAGAIYSPMEQTIRLEYSCDDGVKIYVDGVAVVQTFRPDNNSHSDAITVGPGYHQVFIKLANEFTLSLLEFKVQGSGLGWATSIPADIPEGAQLFSSGVPLMEALRLGPDVFVGTFGEDFINETTVRPMLGVEVAPGLSWQDAMSANGTWAVDATGLTGPQSFAVSYLALGIYAPVDTSLVFLMTVPSALAVWYDGANVLRVDGSQMSTYADNVYVSTGWHQVIIKIGAASGTIAQFSLTPTDMTGPLAWALAPEYSLPPGVSVLKSGAPVVNMLALATTASMPQFGPSPTPGDFTTPTGIIPFGPGTANAALTMSDILLDGLQLEPYDTAAVAALPSNTFQWLPVEGRATWGEEGMGGMFNLYYGVTLYASQTMSAVQANVANIGASFAMWVDGQLVGSATISGGGPETPTSVPLTLSQGYHQVILKLQAPSDFLLDASGGQRLTWSAAQSICHNNGYRQVCSLGAYCPYGQPRKGVLPTTNGSFFMPYRDAQNGWVQTGTGGNMTSTCQTWMSSHGNTPSWGQSSSTAYPFRGTVGCCGTRMPPSVSLSFDTSGAQTNGGILGWAYGFPEVDVAMPRIFNANPRARIQTITMNCTTPNATIYYTTDFSTPTRTSMRYTGPFNVTSTTFIAAIALVNSKSQSFVSFFQVNVLPHPVIERTECVAYAACFVPAVSVDPGWYFAFVPTSWNATMLRNVANSIVYASSIAASPTYSGLVLVQSDNGLLVPPLASGPYYAISYDGSGAGTVAATLLFTAVGVTPSQVVATKTTLFQFTGGVQTNDGILFLDPLYGAGADPVCSASNCARGFADYPSRVLTVRNNIQDFVTTVDLSNFEGTLHCLCVCATGSFAPPGVILPSAFVLMEEIASAVPIAIQVLAPNPDSDVVTNVSPSIAADGDTLTLSGNFSINSSATAYTLTLLPGSQQPAAVPVPTCFVASANASQVQCTLTVRTGTSGIWYVHLFYRGNMVPSTGLFSITAVPTAATVTGASGSCAEVSSDCVSGAVMFFYGANFDTVTTSYNDVMIGGANSGVSCSVINVTTTYVACMLSVSASAPSGTYPVTISVYVSADYTMTTNAGASIILGAGSKPGWNGGGAPSHTPAPQGNLPAAPADDKAAIIAGSLSGVVVLLVVALLIIRFRYSLVPKSVQQSKEMDYIEEQLMEEAQQGNSPRARQSSLEPEPIREQGQTRYVAPQGTINSM